MFLLNRLLHTIIEEYLNRQTIARANMKQLIAKIAQKHQVDGIDINPPANLSEIADFEKQAGFSLPHDFKAFYLACNGFSCNEDLFNMISLSHIRQYLQDFGDNWFYFSEYMDYSEMWGLRFTPGGQYEIFNGSYREITLTSSLTEFLEKFLMGNVFDPGGLYEWQEKLGIQ